jgi:hypothetical protein
MFVGEKVLPSTMGHLLLLDFCSKSNGIPVVFSVLRFGCPIDPNLLELSMVQVSEAKSMSQIDSDRHWGIPLWLLLDWSLNISHLITDVGSIC